jgi:hypothetical protein
MEFEELIRLVKEVLSKGKDDVDIEKVPGQKDTLAINRKPKGEPTLFSGEDGDVYVEWKEKFERQKKGQHPPFAQGEKVYVQGILMRDEHGNVLHVDEDGRIADNFFVGQVAEDVALHEGMPLEALVEIGKLRHPDYTVSNIQDYDAKLIKAIGKAAVNPSEAEIKKNNGKRVIVEGEFVGFEKSAQDSFLESLGFPEGSGISGSESGFDGQKNYATINVCLPDGSKARVSVDSPPCDWYSDGTVATVKTANGAYRIKMGTGRIRFSGGVLENLSDKNPLPGDVVRIAANAVNGELLVDWCSPCRLLMASEKRQADYDAIRKKAASELEAVCRKLGDRNYADARRLIAEAKKLQLTGAEWERIGRMVARMPAGQKPLVMEPMDSFRIEAVDTAYRVMVESMTEQEFFDFALDAVQRNNGERFDIGYLFDIARGTKIDKGKQEEILEKCLQTNLQKVLGKSREDMEFYDEYSVERAVVYLAVLGTETAFERIFGFLYDAIEKTKTGDLNLSSMLLLSASEALSFHMHNIPMNMLIGNQARLKQARLYLAEHEQDYAADNLAMVIDYIKEKAGDF